MYEDMPRPDGRPLTMPRRVEMIVGFHRPSEGSVLYRAGGTVVLCTASIDTNVPEFLRGKGKGWLTAEYQMHPRANPPRREQREGRNKPPSGRTQEIQRLIGRALRAALDLDGLGERTIAIDCDVLEADGGTRTASITGGFVALGLALGRLQENGQLTKPVLRDVVAAISVGHLERRARPRPRLPRGQRGARRSQPRRHRARDHRRSARARPKGRPCRAKTSTPCSTSDSPA